MATLKIVIKREWFDEIKSRVKKVDYREITPFWTSRLYTSDKKKGVMKKLNLLTATIKMQDE